MTTEVVSGSSGLPAMVSVEVAPSASGSTGPVTLSVLGAGSNGADLTATLPDGVGLTVTGPQGTLTTDSVLSALASAQAGMASPSEDQAAAIEAASRYLAGLPPETMLTVRAVTPTLAAGAQPSAPITLTGGTGPVQEALVIDARGLPQGAVLQLDGVDYAVIAGNVQVSMLGGSGYLVGDGQSQTIVAGLGNDTLAGGMGADALTGLDGADLLEGNMAGDVLMGVAGADTLNGGKGHDQLEGGAQADLIRGGLGNDSLFGGKGHDLLEGGVGDDRLTGALGNDTLLGGEGADGFVFGAADGGHDVILDFAASDRLEIVTDGSAVAGMSVQELLAGHLAAASDGSAVLRFGEGGVSLTFSGVSTETLLSDTSRILIVPG